MKKNSKHVCVFAKKTVIGLALFSVLFLTGPLKAQNYAESSLDNGIIKVGINTNAFGGAITYLSESGSGYNLINNYDRGRQVQQSYYAGDMLDRRAAGQHSQWSPWSWNPIQVGDVYGYSSKVLVHSNNGSQIYVKTQPLLWDMSNELAQCYFETWIRLDGIKVVVSNKLTAFRTDSIWTAVVARHQELPAVYTIADLMHMYTYEGYESFTDGPLQKLVDNGRQVPTGYTAGPPWFYWGTNGIPTEKWAAFVNNSNWGMGVYNGDAQLFIGGFSGSAGGDTKSFSTGYVSPLRTESFTATSVFQYSYTLIVGNLDSIRDQVYQLQGCQIWSRGAGSDSLPADGNWRFGRAPLSGEAMVFGAAGANSAPLSYSGTFGGAAGIGLQVGAGRTVPLHFTPDNPAVFRLRGGTNVVASGAGPVTFESGGSNAVIELGVSGTNRTFFFNNYSAQPLTFASGTVLQRSAGLTNADLYFRGTGEVCLSGTIGSLGNGLIQVRDGLLRLDGTNTHTTGNLDAESGVLEFTSAAAIGATGNRIKLGQANLSGTLKYSGSSEARIGRQIAIGNGGTSLSHTGQGTVDASGAGALVFTNTAFNANATQTNTIVRTLTLTGSSTASNEIRGIIKNNAAGNGRVALAKSGSGLWILSGTNTYTGLTTISNGCLIIRGNQSSATGTVTVASGAALGGGGTLGGDLVLQSGARWLFDPAATMKVRGTITGGFSAGDVAGLGAASPVGRYTLIQGVADAQSFSPAVESEAQNLGGNRYAWFEVGTGTVELVVAEFQRYADWMQQYGLSGADTNWAASPAGDGINNLIKYAFNLDPRLNEGAGQYPGEYRGVPYLVPGTAGSGQLQMIYYRDPQKTDIRLTPLRTRTLGGTSLWSEVTDRELTGISGRIEAWRARVPMEEFQGFMEIRVEAE
jgi:autotransporter-associated beta strand protein